MTSDPITIPNRVEEPAHCRPFALSDAMILLAGMALSLSSGSYLFVLLADMFARLCQQAADKGSYLLEHWPTFWNAIRFQFINTLSYSCQIIEMLLVGMTLAFFVIRLRRPRPPLRELARQPGTVAGLAMVFGALWVNGYLQLFFTLNPSIAAPAAIGGTVAVAWTLLALSRSGRAESGWIDRFGRLLGCVAIGNALLHPCVFWL